MKKSKDFGQQIIKNKNKKPPFWVKKRRKTAGIIHRVRYTGDGEGIRTSNISQHLQDKYPQIKLVM